MVKDISGAEVYVTAGRNEKAIQEYIKNQEKEDMTTGQISIKEYMDPFKKK